jgi:hypothetical protein
MEFITQKKPELFYYDEQRIIIAEVGCSTEFIT